MPVAPQGHFLRKFVGGTVGGERLPVAVTFSGLKQQDLARLDPWTIQGLLEGTRAQFEEGGAASASVFTLEPREGDLPPLAPTAPDGFFARRYLECVTNGNGRQRVVVTFSGVNELARRTNPWGMQALLQATHSSLAERGISHVIFTMEPVTK